MKGSRVVPTDLDTTWRALNDPEVLRACIPGCESIDRVSDTEYRLAMTARVGPVSAKFTGRLLLADIVAPRSYTLKFEGQGGAAGFANGSAKVELSPVDANTRIDYAANAQVGGKLAQIGSRLIDGAAAKVADDFFARFSERAGGSPPSPAGATEAPPPELAGALRTMRIRLLLAALIVAGIAIYWWLRPA
ncbi:MAG TPA: carbon monoxide dehydrogenase subunit G [Casimicrobiaceae bacterium]|nr:carbon monoxide dehydrogenase subunit G [Casimicrobiaceae bacterium]